VTGESHRCHPRSTRERRRSRAAGAAGRQPLAGWNSQCPHGRLSQSWRLRQARCRSSESGPLQASASAGLLSCLELRSHAAPSTEPQES
jgi:hypothetical protein